MQISQSLACLIANKLVENKQKEYDKLDKEYSEYVYDLYLSQTPDEVKAMFKKHADWFMTTNTVRLHGHGFNYEYCDVKKPVIKNSPNDHAVLKLTEKIVAKINAYKKDLSKIKTERNNLKDDIKTALLQLRTYKQIEKTFPEAAPWLPKQSMALVVDVEPIRRRLKKPA